jgi:hypothetical protein
MAEPAKEGLLPWREAASESRHRRSSRGASGRKSMRKRREQEREREEEEWR